MVECPLEQLDRVGPRSPVDAFQRLAGPSKSSQGQQRFGILCRGKSISLRSDLMSKFPASARAWSTPQPAVCALVRDRYHFATLLRR